MADIVVQLDAYVVPEDHVVLKCSPGKTYRFYKAIRDANAVFLDIHGLEALPTNAAQWDDAEVLRIIAADRYQREQAGGAYTTKKHGSKIAPLDRTRLRFLKGLVSAKRGDINVVPAEGWRKEVLIGEVTNDAFEVTHVEASDGENAHTFVGRPVFWLARPEKRELSTALIDELHRTTALFVLKPSVRDEVYSQAYTNYVHDGRYASFFETTKAHFEPLDSSVVTLWFAGLEAVRSAVATGTEAKLPPTFLQIAMMEGALQNPSQLEVNTNSPAQFLLKSAGVFALALMTMLPLTPATAATDTVNVKIHTVGSASDACRVEIDAAVAIYMKTLGVDRWKEACDMARRARDDATLKTAARLITPRQVRK